MIGYTWAVYHQHSVGGSKSAGILAGGITDKPHKAQQLVEAILAAHGDAAWGCMLRVAVAVSHPERSGPVDPWPPAGETQICTRTNDGYRWRALAR